MEDAIRIEGLRKVFRSGLKERLVVVALDRLDLRVAPGEVFGLLGPNGSGKSTAIKILLNLVQPSAGHCLIFGQSASQPEVRQRVGYVPEAPFFYTHLSGREVIRTMGSLSGLRGADLTSRVDSALELVGISHAADRSIRTYSKGMLQRLGLAQAMVHDPELVILDEPTAGVDPIGARAIADLIVYLKQQGKTVLLCSHLLSQVETVCDRVAILHQGIKLREGRVSDLTEGGETETALVFSSPGEMAKAEACLQEAGLPIQRSARPGRSLEEVFIEMVERRNQEGGKS